jgi:D-lactate dehydrogenase (cytochrome)
LAQVRLIMPLQAEKTRGRHDPEGIVAVVHALSALLGHRLVTARGVREQHGNTVSWIPDEPPDAVAYPESTEDVQQIVRICAAHRVPVIPFGAGTSLEGHVNAPFGGVCIDFRDMNRVLAVHADDLDCVVQPGVTRKQLNQHLHDCGLFFPVDPGADASLGGMAATRASGTNAVRYGTMKDNVLALKVVSASGEVISTGRRARKSSAGYDLTRLFVGSEGTLGIITELTLRLHGLPEAIAGGVCPFPTLEAACNAAIRTIQSGIPVARIELLDALQVKACNAYSNLKLPEIPMLFVEFHGSEAAVAEQARDFGEIAEELGGGPFEWATKPDDRARLWQARHEAYWAAGSLRAGSKTLTTDFCVPISRLAECIMATQRDIVASGIIAPVIGHVGDGNFHFYLLVDTHDAAEVKKAGELHERLVERALAMDGTCTGEHGIGQGKLEFMPLEHGAAGLAAMRQIKQALDPQNIFNPGKLVPLSR